MLRRIALTNFKSIRDEIQLELADLTVMTGSNSSGKSTVLQSLLLIAQTLRHSGSDRQLVLNGPLVRLGKHSDIANAHSPGRPVGIGLEIAPTVTDAPEDSPQGILSRAQRPTLVSVRWDFVDRSTKGDLGAPGGSTFPTVERMRIDGAFEAEDASATISMVIHRHPWKREVRVAREGYTEGLSESQLASLMWKVDLDYGAVPDPDGDEVRDVRGVAFDHCLPRDLSVRVDLAQEFARYSIDMLARSTRTETVQRLPISNALWRIVTAVVLAPTGLFPDGLDDARTVGDVKSWIDALPTPERRRLLTRLRSSRDEILDAFARAHRPEPWLWNAPMPRTLQRCVGAVRSELSAVRYLGPLRVQPAPLYPVATTLGSEDVGPSGEWTASVLDAYKDKPVTYAPPEGMPFDADNVRVVTTTLADAVNAWMRYLGVSGDVRTVDRGSMGHELTVRASHVEHELPLTHVGVGVSQCLPVVVSLLLARSNTITLLEQPELHLHPAVQSRLADFLLAMTLSGRQCLVETHSEYLVNRLRLRIAQHSGDDMRDRVRIYFATNVEGESEYQEVRVNEFGAITNWPRGFFDDAQDDVEHLLRAAARKRQGAGSRSVRTD